MAGPFSFGTSDFLCGVLKYFSVLSSFSRCETIYSSISTSFSLGIYTHETRPESYFAIIKKLKNIQILKLKKKKKKERWTGIYNEFCLLNARSSNYLLGLCIGSNFRVWSLVPLKFLKSQFVGVKKVAYPNLYFKIANCTYVKSVLHCKLRYFLLRLEA